MPVLVDAGKRLLLAELDRLQLVRVRRLTLDGADLSRR